MIAEPVEHSGECVLVIVWLANDQTEPYVSVYQYPNRSESLAAARRYKREMRADEAAGRGKALVIRTRPIYRILPS